MPARARPLLTLLVAGTFACGTAFSQNTQTASEPEAGPAPSASEGLRAYLDPATGRLIDHPPYGESTLELDRNELYRFSTSHFGFIEQKLPNGKGYAVGLRGRFRQGTAATVDSPEDSRIHRLGGEIFLSPAGLRIQEEIIQDRVNEPKDES